jgi:hypothetical protein
MGKEFTVFSDCAPWWKELTGKILTALFVVFGLTALYYGFHPVIVQCFESVEQAAVIAPHDFKIFGICLVSALICIMIIIIWDNDLEKSIENGKRKKIQH